MDYIKIRFGSNLPIESSFGKSMGGVFRPRPANPMFSSGERSWTPQMDIFETPEEIIIQAEIAGVNQEDLEVEINSKAVRIFGRRAESPMVSNATYRLAEIQYGKFERTLFLPAQIDTEVVSSSYSNGFLQLRLAKKQKNITHSVPITDE
jgi:HSP20 family protein